MRARTHLVFSSAWNRHYYIYIYIWTYIILINFCGFWRETKRARQFALVFLFCSCCFFFFFFFFSFLISSNLIQFSFLVNFFQLNILLLLYFVCVLFYLIPSWAYFRCCFIIIVQIYTFQNVSIISLSLSISYRNS